MERRSFLTGVVALAALAALPPEYPAAETLPAWVYGCEGCGKDHRPFNQLMGDLGSDSFVGYNGCDCDEPVLASKLNEWLRTRHKDGGAVVLWDLTIDCDEAVVIPSSASKAIVKGCRFSTPRDQVALQFGEEGGGSGLGLVRSSPGTHDALVQDCWFEAT